MTARSGRMPGVDDEVRDGLCRRFARLLLGWSIGAWALWTWSCLLGFSSLLEPVPLRPTIGLWSGLLAMHLSRRVREGRAVKAASVLLFVWTVATAVLASFAFDARFSRRALLWAVPVLLLDLYGFFVLVHGARPALWTEPPPPKLVRTSGQERLHRRAAVAIHLAIAALAIGNGMGILAEHGRGSGRNAGGLGLLLFLYLGVLGWLGWSVGRGLRISAAVGIFVPLFLLGAGVTLAGIFTGILGTGSAIVSCFGLAACLWAVVVLSRAWIAGESRKVPR